MEQKRKDIVNLRGFERKHFVITRYISNLTRNYNINTTTEK